MELSASTPMVLEAGRFTKDQDLAVTNNFRIGGIGTIPNLVSSAATITNATITTLTVENTH